MDSPASVFCQDERIDDSLARALGVGLHYMTVSDVPATESVEGWTRHFAALNRLGERVRRAGMQLGLHTQADMGRSVDGAVVMDALLRNVEPQNCRLQLDLSTTQSMGVDPVGYLQRYPGRFFALICATRRHRRSGAAMSSPCRSAKASST